MSAAIQRGAIVQARQWLAELIPIEHHSNGSILRVLDARTLSSIAMERLPETDASLPTLVETRREDLAAGIMGRPLPVPQISPKQRGLPNNPTVPSDLLLDLNEEETPGDEELDRQRGNDRQGDDHHENSSGATHHRWHKSEERSSWIIAIPFSRVQLRASARCGGASTALPSRLARWATEGRAGAGDPRR